MFESRMRALLLMGLCLAALSSGGCKDDSAQTPAQSSRVSDPVEVAHERGRQWAQINKAVLVSDCGALADDDERFGCADYVNHLPH